VNGLGSACSVLRRLTLARELHAALELLQRLLERQIAALHARDERFELLERLLEAAEAVLLGCAHAGGTDQGGATVHSVPATVKRAAVDRQ
jgi:hypothetical protein